jgi:hypothetical protein
MADVKRRLGKLQEKCRLARRVASHASSLMRIGAGENRASGIKSRNVNHLAELLAALVPD